MKIIDILYTFDFETFIDLIFNFFNFLNFEH